MSYVKKDQITDVFALSQSFQHNELVVAAWRGGGSQKTFSELLESHQNFARHGVQSR